MKIIYLNLIFPVITCLAAQAQPFNQGARFASLGNTGVALQDVWSLQANQAGITNIKKATLGVSYAKSVLNPELSSQALVLVLPVKGSSVGLSFRNYGISSFNEQSAGLAFGRRFGKSFAVSLGFNLHQVNISGYGNARDYSAEVGFQYYLQEHLTLGAHVWNLGRAGFGTGAETRLPPGYELGLAYEITDKLLFVGSYMNAQVQEEDLRCGLEYSVVDKIALRGGIGMMPGSHFAGFGYKSQSLKLDAAATFIRGLRYSPQVGVGYEF